MSSEDLFTKFEDLVAKSVTRIKKEFNNIEEERDKLTAEVEALKAEQQRMKSFEVSDDMIDLNVGGQRFTTTRSTLCQVEGSLLATMFSGRWERGQKRDKDGAIFFDFNPQYFVLILDYLRARKIASADNLPPFPTVSKDQQKTFTSLVEYLGLSDEVLPSEKFTIHSTNVALQESGKVAVHDQTTGYGFALGETVYNKEIVNLKLKLESFENNQWMFVGVIRDDAVMSVSENNVNISRRWSGSYGWAFGIGGGRVCKDGNWTIMNMNTSIKLSKQGDMLELVLDCDAGKLSLHLPNAVHKFHIDIPKFGSWRLHTSLHCPNDTMRIM
jgi:hypothetical protein